MRPLWFDSPPAHTGSRPRARRGSALLEAALALAIFAPLAVVAGRYAWGYYQYQSLYSAVEGAARYGAASSMLDGVDAWKAGVRRYAVCGSPKPCTEPRVPRLQPENVQVELVRDTGASAAVQVSIQGFTLTLPGGRRTFDGAPSARFPRTESSPQ